MEDYRRQKRRRTLDKAHEERLKARMDEDGDQFEDQDVWGGSDEEVCSYTPNSTVTRLLVCYSLTTLRKNSCGELPFIYTPHPTLRS